jgi:hypothetical protein
MAERGGFEPPVPSRAHVISSHAPSTGLGHLSALSPITYRTGGIKRASILTPCGGGPELGKPALLYPGLGGWRHVKDAMFFPESDLDQIKKVPAQKFPADRARTESRVQLKVPKLGVQEPNSIIEPVSIPNPIHIVFTVL